VLAVLGTGKYAEAETLSREARAAVADAGGLALPLRAASGVVLGEALVRQRKFLEAEPLLLESCEAERNPAASAAARQWHRRAAALLAELYAATDRPDKAAEWRAKLPQSHVAETDPSPTAPATLPAPSLP
jgi:hypothetical protein